MSKKTLFIIVSTLVILFLGYKVSSGVIIDTVDDANERGIELYASSIRYAYTAHLYKYNTNPSNIDDLDIKVTTKVECEKKSISPKGEVELRGCTVEDSKTKYRYINGKVEKE